MLEYGVIYREELKIAVFRRFGPMLPGLHLKDIRLGVNQTRKFVLLLIQREEPGRPGFWFMSDLDRGTYESTIAACGHGEGAERAAWALELRGFWTPAEPAPPVPLDSPKEISKT